MESLDSKFLNSELQMQYEQTWIKPVTPKKIFALIIDRGLGRSYASIELYYAQNMA